jgi:hypothetical protein
MVLRAFFAVPYPALIFGGCVGLLKTAILSFLNIFLLGLTKVSSIYTTHHSRPMID